jgi:hypothetical protein
MVQSKRSLPSQVLLSHVGVIGVISVISVISVVGIVRVVRVIGVIGVGRWESIFGNGEVDGIIERTMLSDGDNDWLMVGSSVYRRESVYTRWKTIGNVGSEHATVGSGVETFEECEHAWVGGCGLLQGCDFLDHDVRVALNLTLRVEYLRGGKVVLLSVNEESGLHVLDVHLNGELSFGLEDAKVEWKLEFGGGHVVDGRDKAHGGGITRSAGNLLPIGEGQIGEQTEVDEVVGRSQGSNLASDWDILAVIGKAWGDDTGVKPQ